MWLMRWGECWMMAVCVFRCSIGVEPWTEEALCGGRQELCGDRGVLAT
jgi:hypothetical protein